jgi:peptidoglycan L-alanyl-D-glutamate endopeptidase CwlK
MATKSSKRRSRRTSSRALRAKEISERRNEERLSKLHPILAIRARCMVELCRHQEIALLVTQGLRTWEQQDELYAKGRTTPPLGKRYVVTNAKGGQSYHNFGLAFDIVILDGNGKPMWDAKHPSWQRVGEIGKSVGLAWGGDWKTFVDLAHFEYTCDVSLQVCRDLYPSGLEAIWKQII